MQFLLFTLYAPMASFGEIAVGERRMGWARPGRSAVLGLVAAAQGRERTDQDAHASLEASLHYAVRTDAPGRSFMDYHTAQTPTSRKGKTYKTRREELGADTLNTVLSTREWRADALFTACLWPRSDGTVHLGDLASALRRPRFALYLGRKSAPLGLPLDPAIVEAATLLEAFETRQTNPEEGRLLERIGSDAREQRQVAFDADVAPELVGGRGESRQERRRDRVVDRVRWQFAERLERVVDVEGEAR